MLAGMFRFVCQNGLVCGDTVTDVRVHHKGSVIDHVIEGACEVLHGFEQVQDSRDGMRAIALSMMARPKSFARSAWFSVRRTRQNPADHAKARSCAPVVSTTPTRTLWTTFNRVQKNSSKVA